jgi:uncharacterized Zn-finger protein
MQTSAERTDMRSDGIRSHVGDRFHTAQSYNPHMSDVHAVQVTGDYRERKLNVDGQRLGRATFGEMGESAVFNEEAGVDSKQFEPEIAFARHHQYTSSLDPHTTSDSDNTLEQPAFGEATSNVQDPYSTEQSVISCHLCGKLFANQAALTWHMQLHTSQSMSECTVCHKTFTSRSQIAIHMRAHSGERPFSCDVCNSSFTTQSNLQRHHKSHTGERTHQCPVCQQKFRRGEHLRRHMANKCSNQLQ